MRNKNENNAIEQQDPWYLTTKSNVGIMTFHTIFTRRRCLFFQAGTFWGCTQHYDKIETFNQSREIIFNKKIGQEEHEQDEKVG